MSRHPGREHRKQTASVALGDEALAADSTGTGRVSDIQSTGLSVAIGRTISKRVCVMHSSADISGARSAVTVTAGATDAGSDDLLGLLGLLGLVGLRAAAGVVCTSSSAAAAAGRASADCDTAAELFRDLNVDTASLIAATKSLGAPFDTVENS